MLNRRKGFIVPVLLAIIAILVAGGTYVVVKSRPTTSNTPANFETTSETINSNITASNSDWKTYTNSNNGYIVSYPSSYHVYLENNLINYDENKYEKGNPNGIKIQIQKSAAPAKFNLKDDTSIMSYLNLSHANEEVLPRSDITVISLGQIKYKQSVLGGPGGAFDIYYAFPKFDTETYYQVLVWGEINDPVNIKKVLSSIKLAPVTTIPSQPDPTQPIINSINPSSGPSGTTIDIIGNNLAGFEGDLIADIKRFDGKTARIYSIAQPSPNLIRIKLAPPCQKGETIYGAYSGNASVCDYFEFIPGVYEISTGPWGKLSNKVQFTITK